MCRNVLSFLGRMKSSLEDRELCILDWGQPDIVKKGGVVPHFNQTSVWFVFVNYNIFMILYWFTVPFRLNQTPSDKSQRYKSVFCPWSSVLPPILLSFSSYSSILLFLFPWFKLTLGYHPSLLSSFINLFLISVVLISPSCHAIYIAIFPV